MEYEYNMKIRSILNSKIEGKWKYVERDNDEIEQNARQQTVIIKGTIIKP